MNAGDSQLLFLVFLFCFVRCVSFFALINSCATLYISPVFKPVHVRLDHSVRADHFHPRAIRYKICGSTQPRYGYPFPAEIVFERRAKGFMSQTSRNTILVFVII